MSWRQVPPHRRVPFEGYPQEAREALLERIAQEAGKGRVVEALLHQVMPGEKGGGDAHAAG